MMKDKKYKLHLTNEQLKLMQMVYNKHAWKCHCSNFPYCKDFKMFQKMKNRIKTLSKRSINNQFAGKQSHKKLKAKYMIEGISNDNK